MSRPSTHYSRDRLWAAVPVLLVLFACGDSSSGPQSAGVVSVVITPTTLELTSVGQVGQLGATGLDSDGLQVSDITLSWSSEDGLVAGVDQDGRVTAIGNGSTRIRAEAPGGAFGEAVVEVQQVVTVVEFSESDVSFAALGETVELEVEAKDALGNLVTDPGLTWFSEDESVASVDQDGRVTAIGNGSTRIGVSAANTELGYVQVEVSQVITGLDVSPESVAMTALEESRQLMAIALDALGNPVPDAEVTWSSEDLLVASVDGEGRVTAQRNGTTRIEASVSPDLARYVEIVVEQQAVKLVVVVQPSDAAAGIPFLVQPVIEVQDANGHPVEDDAGRMVTARLAAGAASRPEGRIASATPELEGTLGVPTVGGRASFTDLAVGGPSGSYQLRFEAAGLEAGSSEAFPLTPGPVEEMVIVSGDGAIVIGGASIEVRIRAVDGYANPVPGLAVEWEVLSGGGKATPGTVATDASGEAVTLWETGTAFGQENRLRAEIPQDGASREVTASTVAPTAPYRFPRDAEWTSPSRGAPIIVHDAVDREVPPSLITYDVGEPYGCCEPPGLLTVDEEGIARQILALTAFSYPVRVQASVMGTDVDGLVLVLAHRTDDDRTVHYTEHWRLFLPIEWLQTIDAALPGFEAGLDVGWAAQVELMGQFPEAAAYEANPSNPILPISTAREDPTTCGLSTVPISFGRGCFLFIDGPLLGHPHWDVIFHELGHGMNGVPDRSIFCLLYSCPHAPQAEGDATLFGLWSLWRIAGDPHLSQSIRESADQTRIGIQDSYENALQAWEASSMSYSEGETGGFNPSTWDGILGRFMEEFGWDWIPLYARSYRNDPVVRGLMDIDGAGPTLDMRATYAAAAVSAAIGQDVRDRFKGWRFPVDDSLFDALYDHLVDAVQVPWEDTHGLDVGQPY